MNEPRLSGEQEQAPLAFALPPSADTRALFAECAGFSLDASAADAYATQLDEAFYLKHNPGVERQIAAGEFSSAEAHWIEAGRSQHLMSRRRLLPNPDFQTYNAFMDECPALRYLLVASFSLANRTWWEDFCRALSRQSYRLFDLAVLHELDAAALADLRATLDRFGLTQKTKLLAQPGDLSHHLDADYATFLDAANLLPPDSLYWCTQALLEKTGADALYTDEALVTEDGDVAGIYCKPGWSPDFFLSQGYSCGLTLFAASRLRPMLDGGTLPITGAAEFAATLQLMKTQGARLHHLPRPAFVRRLLPEGSDAAAALRTNLARATGLVAEHHASLGLDSDRNVSAAMRLAAPKLATPARETVSVIIPTADRAFTCGSRTISLLDACLAGLKRSTGGVTLEIVAVHNSDMPAARRAELKAQDVKLVAFADQAFNFSRKVNIGIAAASSEHLLILNDDIYPACESWLDNMLASLAVPGVGAVGAKLLYPDRRLQHGGVGLFRGGPYHINHGKPPDMRGYADLVESHRDLAAVTGACVLTTRSAVSRAGGWDEEMPDLYNDIDFCLRLRDVGLRTVYDPRALLYHIESGSLDPARSLSQTQLKSIVSRWGKGWDLDPYYNRRLSEWAPYRWQHDADIGQRWKSLGETALDILD